jgi:hypothetical protein
LLAILQFGEPGGYQFGQPENCLSVLGAQFSDDAAMFDECQFTVALPFPTLARKRTPERIGPRFKQRTVRRRG